MHITLARLMIITYNNSNSIPSENKTTVVDRNPVVLRIMYCPVYVLGSGHLYKHVHRQLLDIRSTTANRRTAINSRKHSNHRTDSSKAEPTENEVLSQHLAPRTMPSIKLNSYSLSLAFDLNERMPRPSPSLYSQVDICISHHPQYLPRTHVLHRRSFASSCPSNRVSSQQQEFSTNE